MPLVILLRGSVIMRRLGLACLLAVLAIATSLASTNASTGSYAPPHQVPRFLIIPRIGVRAAVENLTYRRPADLLAPYKWADTAWFDRGPRPGDIGRALIFGHVDSTCCPAVFWYLHDLHKGDTVQVAYPGKTLTFRVMWQGTYANDHLPTKFLFAHTGERGLSLVTCAGYFHRDGTGYDHKLIVYARLVLPGGKLG